VRLAAAEGAIANVRMITRKLPLGLLGAPNLEAIGIDIDGLTEPKRVFAGTAREAARGFPFIVIFTTVATDMASKARPQCYARIGPQYQPIYPPQDTRPRSRPSHGPRKRCRAGTKGYQRVSVSHGGCVPGSAASRPARLSSKLCGATQGEAAPDVAERVDVGVAV
jgi:hypothetical protein